MSKKYVYVGLFVDKEELLRHIDEISREHLSQVIENPHVTLEFMPDTVNEALFGEEAEIRAFAYANDGENEGVAVEVVSENIEISAMVKNVKTPHITISVSDDGKPVNTALLNFKSMKPFVIKGMFSGVECIEK